MTMPTGAADAADMGAQLATSRKSHERFRELSRKQGSVRRLMGLAIAAVIVALGIIGLRAYLSPINDRDVSPAQTSLIDAITAPPDAAMPPLTWSADIPPESPDPVDPRHIISPENRDLIGILRADIDDLAQSIEQLGADHRLSISMIRDDSGALVEELRRIRQAQNGLAERVSGLESNLALLHEEIRQVRDLRVTQRSAATVRSQQPSPERPQWIRTWGGEKMAGFRIGAFSVGDQVGEWKISDIDVAQQRVTVVSLRDPRREQTLTPTSSDQ